MRVRRWLTAAAAAGCAALLGIGLWRQDAAPEPAPDTAQQPLWVLRDTDGRQAQYEYGAGDDAAPLHTWQVYTALLPSEDRQKLAEGIPIYTAAELRQLVEDLGG